MKVFNKTYQTALKIAKLRNTCMVTTQGPIGAEALMHQGLGPPS